MPHLESRVHRMRNTRLIEERNRAARRMVWWSAAGVFGVALYILARGTAWQYDGRMIAVGATTITLVVTAAVGFVTEGLIALEPIEPDELHTERTYADADAPPARLVQRDENVTIVIDPNVWGGSSARQRMAGERLDRAGWRWSRDILNGRPGERALVTTAEYPQVTAEMERAGIIERDGRGYRVTALGQDYFTAPPAPQREPPRTADGGDGDPSSRRSA